jgi:glyoxylase-like metal-dependent hydrolase (beta-lactamase superfamily II)
MERRHVGNVDVIALIDNTRAYPATAVYPAAGDSLARFSAYFDPNGSLVLNFAAFLLIDGEHVVLVDTGWGPEQGGQLLTEMASAGVEPARVTIVTFTHLHGDHTGWSIDRQTGEPLFRNARYLVPRGDWDHYSTQQPAPASFTRDIEPLRGSGRLELITGEETLSPSLTTLPTPGHTPGHTSVALSSNGEQGFILGDVVIGLPDAELPSLQTSFDWDHAIARRTREATIAQLAASQALVGASHLPAPGLGRFVVEGGTSRWVRA